MEQENIQKNPYHEDEIDLIEVFKVLWKEKLLIILFTTIFAISSVLYALSLPNKYTSTSLLASANQNNSLSSKLGSYSSLAGLAGVTLPKETATSSDEAIARIKSFDFFSMHFLPYIKLEDLFAVKKWNSDTNLLIYNEKLFDSSKNAWTRDEFPAKPSEQEAYEVYQKILSISENQTTSFVTISIEHFSPYVAQKWVKTIIKNINESMRSENMKISSNSINYLKERSQSTNIKEIRDAISQLLQSQMQSLMLATANENYVYKIINSPIAPERKSSPGRAFISIFGTLIGFIIAILISIIRYYYKKG